MLVLEEMECVGILWLLSGVCIYEVKVLKYIIMWGV